MLERDNEGAEAKISIPSSVGEKKFYCGFFS
jgi:hypothetical protein